jgi:hypothetical protein
MKYITLLFSTVLSLLLITSCECTKVECGGNSNLYIDIIDRDTGESQLFGPNSTLNISDITVFSQEGGTMISYPTIEFSKASLSADPFLLINLENIVGRTLIVSTDNTSDTLELSVSNISASDCCDESINIDSVNYNGLDYIFSEWPIRIMR